MLIDAITLAALVGACACINRFRGGGLYADRIPGHPRFYAAVAVALLTFLLVTGPMQAAIVGACYLAWAWLPWGRWFDIGHLPDGYTGRPANPFEKAIERLPGNDAVHFTVRNLIGLTPAMVFIDPGFFILAAIQTVAYALGWEVTPRTPTVTGEWITGAGWGWMIWWLA